MNNVATIKPHILSVQCPEALRHLQGWLTWRYEDQPGEGKPRKVPYYTSGGRRHGVQGRAEDRQSLTSFDAARASAAKRGHDGVGLALMPDFKIVAGDFDNCMTPTGLHPDVAALVEATYAEYSPSGNGVRAFWLGNLGNDKSIGVEPFGFEAFSSKGFVTFTGNSLPGYDLVGLDNTVAQAPDSLRAFCNKRFGRHHLTPGQDFIDTWEPPIGLTSEQISEALDVIDADSPHSTWLNVGMALHHETQGSGFELWNDWSSRGAKYPGEESLQRRWDSFGQATGRVVTARSLIKLAQENGAHIGVSQVAHTAEFEALVDQPTPAGEKSRFPIIDAGEFSRGARPTWMIKNLLPRAELVVLFGVSGSGKTFMVLDMAMSIARGVDWRGLRTKPGRVVYIAAEGAGGFRNRLQAYAQHNQLELDGLPIGVIQAAPNFLQKTDALDLAKSVIAYGPVDLIIVDTFAQTTPGANENSGEDVGRAITHCKGLHRATGAVVLLVHHSGKDASRGARGWSGLKAAADAEIEIVRTTQGRVCRTSKQKDAADGLEWGFDLEVVSIGFDEDGDEVSSCVVVEAALPIVSQVAARKLGEWEKLIMEVVSEFGLAQSSGIEIRAVMDEVISRRGPPGEGKRDSRRQHAKRALNNLCLGDDAPFLSDGDCLDIL